jgi:hypothetical protein
MIRADVTDLLALPALYGAWLVHQRASSHATGDWRSLVARATGVAMVPVAAFATAATSCDSPDYGITGLTVVQGEFAGPPEHPETRVLFDYDMSVDERGALAELPQYDQMRLAAGGDYGDGQRTCDDSGACWRASGLEVETSFDSGRTWQGSYALDPREAERAIDEVDWPDDDCHDAEPVADFRELAVLGTGDRSVVVVAASAAGVLVRTPDASWRLLTVQDIRDIERLPEPSPTPREGFISPVPARPTEDETPWPTQETSWPGEEPPALPCESPTTVSVTPDPRNGPPTTYPYCP